MGWYDYISDLSTSFSSTFTATTLAESPDDGNRGATTRGGASTDTPEGYDQESGSEVEANKADADKAEARGGDDEEAPKGQVPGEGGEGSGQKGASGSGPHGGSVKTDDDEDEGGDEEEEEEEEDEEEEPEDVKPKLEEECMKTQECQPLKHHYDECAERVTHQQNHTGKAHEDCVEEFFHLMHCASQCAAPKLFAQLR